MKPYVLIVDDSLTIRMDLKDAFVQTEFEPLLCDTIECARKNISLYEISLVILDVQLPDGDGIEFMKELKSNSKTASVPVLCLSSEAEVKDRARGLSTGADDYVGKPYETSYVIARAHELVRARASAQTRKTPAVLVIDDSVTYREAVKSTLEASGYSVVLAETGEEGLRRALEVLPDAIVVDGQLPGIDGSTVIRRVRSDSIIRSTPCILLTAAHGEQDEFNALEAGADAYIHKNEEMPVLMARLGAILKAGRSAASIHFEKSLLAPKKILVVDDSLTYIHEISDLLREDGYDVVTAASGEECLALLNVQIVDCILLDRIMPGISGEETCRNIKVMPAWRDIPVLILTAHEGAEAMLDGFNAGADDYISKSSETQTLKARLRAHLRRKQFEDENRQIREELLKKEVEASEARANRELAETRARLLEELEHTNKELESFSYSVSHDLRGPLTGIISYSELLLEECGNTLNADGMDYLKKVLASATRMRELITGLMDLSQVTKKELQFTDVDLSEIVMSLAEEMRNKEPSRSAEFVIARNVYVHGDSRLLRAVLMNLLSNAWKFTLKNEKARIEFGVVDKSGVRVYFVKDNGDGFDMANVGKLFGAFQRLHSEKEFQGTGIGLATVQRIIRRHGGRIWAEGVVKEGATFYFTLSDTKAREQNIDADIAKFRTSAR